MLVRSFRASLLLTIGALALAGTTVRAASVFTVATLGGAAPGGGIFAGSGFLGRPAGAGDGWVVFRSLVAPSGSTEELVLANLSPSASTRRSVARTGEELSAELGTIDDFIGHPAVNASGEVAFVVTLNPPEPPPDGEPAPAALVRYDPVTGVRTILATAGSATPVGPLALAEGLGDGTPTLDDRTPSIADDGDVAFSALGIDGDTETPAVFVVRGGTISIVAAAGDPAGNGTLETFGPPVLNGVDHLAFSATLSGGTFASAVYLWRDGVLTRLAGDGDTVTTTEPESHVQTIETFFPVVDLDDDDTVAFLAGPLTDFTPGADASDFGVVRWRNDARELLAFPGMSFADRGRVTSFDLLAEFGGDTVPPRLLPGGNVLAHLELNGGSSSALASLASPVSSTELAVAAGGSPSGTPIGGTYAAFTHPPTADGNGALVVVAELDGAPASHALFWDPLGASPEVVVVGEPSPGASGFLAGPPFANPTLTDAGDIVFRSSVASGPSAIGLYRWSLGELTALVRAGDLAPLPTPLPFLNIVGVHATNDAGTVVFAALVEGLGRGIYAVEGPDVVRVAAQGDLVRILSGTTAEFDTLLPNPAIASDGAIAFRARVQFEQSGSTRRRDGIFLRSGAQIRAAVLEEDPAPTGETFELFREASVANRGQVAFIADLAQNGTTTRRGLFYADDSGVRSVVLEGDTLGDRVVGFVGGPELNDRGTIAQLVRIDGPDGEVTALVRGTPARVTVVAQAGDESPAGGTYRSIGRPAMNGRDDVAFRATFEAGSGGSPGLLTATSSDVTPLVSIGDPGPADLRGQFVAFNQRVSLNSSGAVAFLGSLAGGSIREGVFLGEPTALTIPKLRMRIGTSSKPDRLRMKFRLSSSTATRALDLSSSRVRITVQDDGGARWTELISPGGFQKRKKSYLYSRKPLVPRIKLTVAKGGSLVGSVKANPDLTGGGLFTIQPPISIDVEISDVSGRASVNCLTSRKRVRCR